MTVRDLILLLADFPDEALVMIESSGGEYLPNLIHRVERQTVNIGTRAAPVDRRVVVIE